MNKCVIVVDNPNIFIEGRKYSAKVKGVQRAVNAERDPQDVSWRIDFGNLLSYLADGREIHSAILVGSRPPQNDSLWDCAKRSGFEVTLHDRSTSGEEKAVDTELVVQATEVVCMAPEPMALVIASGDRDFIPLVRMAQRKRWEVEMCAFSSSFNVGGEMATEVDRVRPLDVGFQEIGRNDFPWPLPQPAPTTTSLSQNP